MSPRIRRTRGANCLLISGATGLLGGAVVAALAGRSSLESALLVVRGDSTAAGLARVRHNLAKFSVPDDVLCRLKESQILLGDFARPEPMLANARLDGVTHVLNCAAMTTFSPHPRMRAINVDGVRALANRMARVPGMVRFVHVGTAMVCGAQSTGHVYEDWHDSADTAHLVDYTRSKLDGEAALRAELPDARLVVARPSIIVGHSELGCIPSGSIFWTLRMIQEVGGAPFPMHTRIDAIPVDYAARALLHLTMAPMLRHRLYHVSGGAQHSASYVAILDEMDRAIGRARTRYAHIGWNEILARQAKFPDMFGPGNPRLILKAMRLYSGFAALGLTFDNGRLLRASMAPPPSLVDYAAVCARTSQPKDIYAQMISDVTGEDVPAAPRDRVRTAAAAALSLA